MIIDTNAISTCADGCQKVDVALTAQPLVALLNDLKFGVARQHVEISVAMQHWHVGADRHGGYEAINQPAHGFPFTAASTEQRSRIIVVHRFGGKNDRHRT